MLTADSCSAIYLIYYCSWGNPFRVFFRDFGVLGPSKIQGRANSRGRLSLKKKPDPQRSTKRDKRAEIVPNKKKIIQKKRKQKKEKEKEKVAWGLGLEGGGSRVFVPLGISPFFFFLVSEVFASGVGNSFNVALVSGMTASDFWRGPCLCCAYFWCSPCLLYDPCLWRCCFWRRNSKILYL